MELNKTNKGTKKLEVNPEGSTVYARPDEIQLYLEASNLNLKNDSFYLSSEGKLKSVVELVNRCDPEFIIGLAKFLADKGLKLSPVILLSVLSNRKYPFKQEAPHLLYIFNTPARIAEAIAMNKILKLNNSFKERVLTPALENMNEMTLKKNKMRNRKIKLADLIKYLRPTPSSKSMSVLYKAIVENNQKIAALDEKKDFLAIKSSSSTEKENKKEDLAKLVIEGKVPINQLIRNLKYLAEQYDFKKQRELESAVLKTLSETNNYRMLNIFDIVQAAIHVPHFEKALFEVVKKFVDQVKEQFTYEEDTAFLFDTSGSMHDEGLKNGFKYLALLSLIFNKNELYFFSDTLHSYNNDCKKIMSLLQSGAYSSAKKLFDDYAHAHSGGTALLDSLEQLLNLSEKKHIVVISDEVSWEEGSDLTGYVTRMNQFLKGRKLTLINPQVYKGTVFYGNIVGIASLTSTILFDMAMMNDPQGFIKHIRTYKKENGGTQNVGKRTSKERPKETKGKQKKRKN